MNETAGGCALTGFKRSFNPQYERQQCAQKFSQPLSFKGSVPMNNLEKVGQEKPNICYVA